MNQSCSFWINLNFVFEVATLITHRLATLLTNTHTLSVEHSVAIIIDSTLAFQNIIMTMQLYKAPPAHKNSPLRFRDNHKNGQFAKSCLWIDVHLAINPERKVLETWNQRLPPLIWVRAFKRDQPRVDPMSGSGRTQLTTWNFKTLISPERKQIETHRNFWLIQQLGGHTGLVGRARDHKARP